MEPKNANFAISNHTAWMVLAFLMLLGAALRVIQLDSGLWYDEIRTLIESVRPPLLKILTHFPGNNDHPLYSVLAHLSITAFGEHPWSLRLPSVLFGLAAIPMLYVFALQVTERFEAVAAAGLLAISYHHIWFSQNARGYAMLLFWTLLSSYLLLKALKDNRRPHFVAYAAVVALGVYTHLTMVFVVAGHAAVAVWHILFARPGKLDARTLVNPLLGFLLAGLFTLLLYAPILTEVQSFFEQKTVPRSGRVATPEWAFLATLRGLNVGFAMAWGVVLAGILCVAGFWSYLRQSIAVSALFVLPAPIILVAAVVLQRPVFPRFFVVLMGFGLLIVARGAIVVGAWIADRLPATSARSTERVIPVALIAGLTILSFLALPHLYAHPKQDYGQALQFVEKARKDGEGIMVAGSGAEFPYQRYYLKPWQKVESAADLDVALANGPFWLIYTFRPYIEQLQPGLWNAIQAQCAPHATFPGTVADSDIEVRKCVEQSAPIRKEGLPQ